MCVHIDYRKMRSMALVRIHFARSISPTIKNVVIITPTTAPMRLAQVMQIETSMVFLLETGLVLQIYFDLRVFFFL